MAVTAGTQRLNSVLIDFSGATNYATGGTSLGKIAGPLRGNLQRDVQIYSKMDTGSAPSLASIDGSGLVLSFFLSEYNASVIKVLSQNLRPSGANLNYHGAGGNSNYKLGRTLTSSQYLPLVVRSSSDPANYPALYIPRAVIMTVDDITFDMGTGDMMDDAEFVVIGLHDDTVGDCFAFGDIASFPSLS